MLTDIIDRLIDGWNAINITNVLENTADISTHISEIANLVLLVSFY